MENMPHTHKSKTAFLKPVVFIYIAKLFSSEDAAKFSMKGTTE